MSSHDGPLRPEPLRLRVSRPDEDREMAPEWAEWVVRFSRGGRSNVEFFTDEELRHAAETLTLVTAPSDQEEAVAGG